VLEEYRKHVAERAAEGIVPKPLDATQMAALVELLKNPPPGEEEFLLDLITNRVVLSVVLLSVPTAASCWVKSVWLSKWVVMQKTWL